MILVSKCLLGVPCRMDGKSREVPEVRALYERGEAVPVCPEQLGGLPTPRTPSEILGERVVNQKGEDVTEAFREGAGKALLICREQGCQSAILKSKSPSCGKGIIHNGLFDGGMTEGDGVLVQLLKKEGIPVLTEQEYVEGLKKGGR